PVCGRCHFCGRGINVRHGKAASTALCKPLRNDSGVGGVDLGYESSPPELLGCQCSRSCSSERIQDKLLWLREELDKERRKLQRKTRRVTHRVGAELGLERQERRGP